MQKSANASTLIIKRQTQLIKAAIRCFSRLGYHSATMRDIADEAGVSPGLIYQYVSDKHDLLSQALQYTVRSNLEQIPQALRGVEDPIARLYHSIDAYARAIATNPQAVLLTYQETKSLLPADIKKMKRFELETNHIIAECIKSCIRANYLAQTDVEFLVYRVIIASQAWPLKYWRLKQIITLDNYLEQAIHTLWTSLLLPRGVKQYKLLCYEEQLCPTNVIISKAHL